MLILSFFHKIKTLSSCYLLYKFILGQKYLHNTRQIVGFPIYWCILFNHEVESCYGKAVDQNL